MNSTQVVEVEPSNAGELGVRLASVLFETLTREADKTKNVLVAPFSVGSALSLVALGAQGKTATQLTSLLIGPSASDESGAQAAEVARKWADIASKIGEAKEVEWVSSNAVWVDTTCSLRPEFDALARGLHGAALVGDMALSTKPDEARQIINARVASETRDRIKELLPPKSLSDESRLVITNAVYFKGLWENTFTENFTEDAPFHLPEGETVTVPMMHNALHTRHGQFPEFNAFELLFRKREISMVFLQPHDNTFESLAKLSDAQVWTQFPSTFNALQTGYVQVSVPRFTVRSSVELANALKKAGATVPFTEDADFSQLTSSMKIQIEQVYHSAFLKVDEHGAEAAAATAFAMKAGCRAPPVAAHYVLDRPFVCVLYHRALHCVLFVARVISPNSAGDQ